MKISERSTTCQESRREYYLNGRVDLFRDTVWRHPIHASNLQSERVSSPWSESIHILAVTWSRYHDRCPRYIFISVTAFSSPITIKKMMCVVGSINTCWRHLYSMPCPQVCSSSRFILVCWLLNEGCSFSCFSAFGFRENYWGKWQAGSHIPVIYIGWHRNE